MALIKLRLKLFLLFPGIRWNREDRVTMDSGKPNLASFPPKSKVFLAGFTIVIFFV